MSQAGARKAGAFEAGHIRGWTPGWEQELGFHQLELTGHAEQLESDYRLFREEFGLPADKFWVLPMLIVPMLSLLGFARA